MVRAAARWRTVGFASGESPPLMRASVGRFIIAPIASTVGGEPRVGFDALTPIRIAERGEFVARACDERPALGACIRGSAEDAAERQVHLGPRRQRRVG